MIWGYHASYQLLPHLTAIEHSITYEDVHPVPNHIGLMSHLSLVQSNFFGNKLLVCLNQITGRKLEPYPYSRRSLEHILSRTDITFFFCLYISQDHLLLQEKKFLII